MSKVYFSDAELAIYDQGFKTGVYATLEEVVKLHPLVEENFYDIAEKLMEYIKRNVKEEE